MSPPILSGPPEIIDKCYQDHTWRAHIGTFFTSEQWDAWFQSYDAYITHFAQIAQDNGAQLFSAGYSHYNNFQIIYM